MENRHQPDWIFILGLPVFIIFLTILGWWWRPSYPQANPEQSFSTLQEDQNAPITWTSVPVTLPNSEIVDTGDPDWLWFKSYEYGFQIKFPRDMGVSSLRLSKTQQDDLSLLIGDFSHPVQMSIYVTPRESPDFIKIYEDPSSGKPEKINTIFINGIKVLEKIQWDRETKNSNKSFEYFFENNLASFSIVGKITANEILSDQIVKSFSFLQ